MADALGQLVRGTSSDSRHFRSLTAVYRSQWVSSRRSRPAEATPLARAGDSREPAAELGTLRLINTAASGYRPRGEMFIEAIVRHEALCDRVEGERPNTDAVPHRLNRVSSIGRLTAGCLRSTMQTICRPSRMAFRRLPVTDERPTRGCGVAPCRWTVDQAASAVCVGAVRTVLA